MGMRVELRMWEPKQLHVAKCPWRDSANVTEIRRSGGRWVMGGDPQDPEVPLPNRKP